MAMQEVCPKCGPKPCADQESLSTIRLAADQGFQACTSDMDFAGLYVMSCRLDESPHLTTQQLRERSELHSKIKEARETAFPSER